MTILSKNNPEHREYIKNLYVFAMCRENGKKYGELLFFYHDTLGLKIDTTRPRLMEILKNQANQLDIDYIIDYFNEKIAERNAVDKK